MSIVIGIKTKDNVYLGADTQVSYGGLKDSLTGECSKLWRVKGTTEGVMGGVGRLRDTQIIQTAFPLIALEDVVAGINYDYVVTSLFDSIYNELLKHNRISRDEHGNFSNQTHNSFLFAYGKELYEISEDGAVIETDDYLVIGSGAEVAMGVLETNKDKTPVERITEAIVACSNKTLYVNSEVDNITSKPIKKRREKKNEERI